MSVVAIVPAAGLGTRLRPLSDAIPKEMLPVGRALALERIVAELHAAGVERIVFVVSPQKEAFLRKHFGESFGYALQPEMRGLGDAILQARALASGASRLLVALGDAVFEEPELGGLTRRVLATDSPISIAVQQVPRERLSKYGVVAPKAGTEGSTFRIQDIVEKPAPDQAPSDFAVTARYVLPDTLFETLEKTPPAKNGEVQLTDALQLLLRAGVPGSAVPLLPGETRHDIGGFETYFKAFVTFAMNDPEYGAALRTYLKETLQL
ncbi:sugar phosphate nucleotidyltransferase [Armatimonas rosea]|uniref:UTP--glucose-1-phosphate uridylyltransferase n=1 Tax=Armatimonas rosea TaxID=685828 RepID=A0A7W9SP66_ARMRO|nr:sugar phosphate nucleotidyltransferase [Armatimonas rosea]MBB6050226.1 UTP--glucose-1-phosphate uridylyltransferase [Armatimonas rosea]